MTPKEIHHFWFGELQEPGESVDKATSKRWFQGGKAFDDEIRDRYLRTIEEALCGKLDSWMDDEKSALSLVLVLDQFTRNVYRDTPRAFAGDPIALSISLSLIESGADLKVFSPIERTFLYMPLEHAEDLLIQQACVTLFEGLVKDVSDDAKEMYEYFLKYAVDHHDIIARFQRFPHRNKILQRPSTDEELAFLQTPGSSF